MNVVKCPHCQAENPEAAQYCGECGIKLDLGREARVGVFSPVSQVTPSQILAVGSTFSERFKIVQELGEGSLGRVYQVFDKALNRDVVLKLIKPEVAAGTGTIENLKNEIKTARKIVHKNVARMLDLNEEKGVYFISMEYVRGQTLRGLLQQEGRLRTEKAVDIAGQVCDGLVQGHYWGEPHLDLNPNNVIMDKEGTAKILDFGVGKAFAGRGLSGGPVTIPVPEYMSPEQAEGKGTDHRSDIYSLGVILYEMVIGRVPFEGETAAAVAQRHTSEKPDIPEEFAPIIPSELSRLILKCLEKDPGKRYQTAAELQSELKDMGGAGRETSLPESPPVSQPEKTPAPTEAKQTETAPQIDQPERREPRVVRAARPRKARREYDLKKFFVPGLAGLAVIVLGIMVWRFILRPSGGASPVSRGADKLSVAVLPFEDLSPSGDQEYAADGMSESLIDALTAVPGLRVPGRTSSFSFKGKPLDASGIGQRLGVSYVLEAGLDRSGSTLHLAAKLIQVKDGRPVWSKEFDRSEEDLFVVQEEIAQDVVKALKVHLPDEGKAPLIRDYTGDMDAYAQYLQGRFLLNRSGKDNLEKSIQSFQEAVKKDPRFAPANAGLADAYIILGRSLFLAPNDAFPKAKAAVLNALQANPNLPEGHRLLGSIKANYDWDFTSAEREYREAIRLAPSSSASHQGYARLLTALGRHEEAIAQIELARTFDPLSAEIQADVGGRLYFARRYDLALEELKKAVVMNPAYPGGHFYLGMVWIQMGQYEEAIKSFQRAALQGAELTDLGLRAAYVYARLGEREQVGKLLTEALQASSRSYVSQVSVAAVYGALGEKDQVFACLDKALAEHDGWLIMMNVYPLLDHVRHDPRLQALSRRIGLQK
jgi:TolB-like protein/Tfp pilus assembly protein PilF